MPAPQLPQPDDVIRVLHVDDEPDQLIFTKQFLEQNDPSIRVESAASSEEALEMIQKQAFDCVVSDYAMPGMDGVELARKIRETSNIPIIIYTGRGSEEVAKAAYAAGVDDYIRKELNPSHYQVLAKRIRHTVERYHTEEMLRESEAKYRTLFENSLQGILIAQGPPTHIVYANPSIAEFMGYTTDELVSLSPSEIACLVHPQDRNLFLSWFTEGLEGKSEFSRFEFRAIKKDGSVIWIETLPVRIKYMGQPAVQATFFDITERKQTEMELQKSEAEKNAILNAIPLTISLKDEEYRYLWVNEALTKELDMCPNEMVGKKCYELSYGRDEPCSGCPHEETLKTSKGNMKIVHIPDRKTLEIYSEPVLDTEGKIISLIEVSRDITEYIRFEKRLEALHKHASEMATAKTYEKIAELSFDSIERVLGFDIGGFMLVKDGFLHEIYSRGVEFIGAYKQPMDGPGITARAVRTGESQRVPDIRTDMDYIAGPAEGLMQLLSELAVPVKVDGKVAAILNLENERLNAFGEEDEKLLEILAEHVASAIKRIQLLEAENLYKEKLGALHVSAAKMASAKNIKEVNKIILETVKGVLGFQFAGIGIVDGGAIRYVESIGLKPPAGWKLPLDGPGVTVRAIKTGRSQLVPDVRLDPDYVTTRTKEDVRPLMLSELAVPIIIEGSAESVINIESDQINAFTEQDQELLEILASHVASSISKLRQMDKLRTSEGRYRTLLEGSLEAVFVIVHERYAYVNKNAAQLLGFSDPSELVGREAIQFVVPEDRERVLTIMRGRVRGEDHPTRYELRLLRRDGTTIDVETHASLIVFDGRPASLAFSRDITERKKYRNRLEALHRHAVELASAEDIQEVVEITLNVTKSVLNFEYISFLAIDGNALKPMGAIGAPIIHFNLPLDGRGLTVRACRTRSPVLVNDVRADPDFVKGPTDSLSELAVPVLINDECVAVLNVESIKPNTFTEQDKKLLEVLASHVGSAIHRLRQLDMIAESRERYKNLSQELDRNVRELQVYSEHLNKLVEEKTQDLLDAERIAAAGRVAVMVGHDLKSPLQAIKNATYLLRKSPEDKGILDMIDKTVNRAADMLEELRQQTGDSPLRIENVDLGSLLKTAVEDSNLPPLIEAKIDLGHNINYVQVDSTKMRRVFDNLIRNSLEAMQDNGRLTISAERVNDTVHVRVSDTGTGIPPEIMQNLFRPFKTTRPKGMGLGLAYCKRVVEAHGGSIAVESKKGEGTTFTITLPVKDALNVGCEIQDMKTENIAYPAGER